MKALLRSALSVLVLVLASKAQALPFTGLTVFGDSLSDNGNAFLGTNQVTEPPFPEIPSLPYVRPAPLLPAVANGPVWVERVGAALGLPVSPALAGGTNYAFGGADSGPLPGITPSPPVPPSLTQQFFQPFPLFNAGPILPTQLYAVWGGGNDIRGALGAYLNVLAQTNGNHAAALSAATDVVTAGVGNIATILAALAAGGAQHILSLNVPDVGLAPAMAFLPPGTAALATGLSAAFNTGLGAAIGNIEAAFALDVIEVDVFTLLRDVAADPAAFGLTNVTDTCLQIGGSGICPNPDEYLFWDRIHPTSVGHAIIADTVLNALVPEPTTTALLLIGVLALRSGCRRVRPARP